MKMFRIIALALALMPSIAVAQPVGQIPANTAWGNSSASRAPAAPTQITSSMLDPNVFVGVLTNTRLAKTAAYPAVTADCGSTIALSGNALYALTFTSGSNYNVACAFAVSNEDTGRGKQILIQVATSSTSLAIGTGSKAFTVASGLNFPVGARVRAWSLADSTKWMSGLVASYASTTLTLTVDAKNSSGTLTDWQIGNETMLWPLQMAVLLNQNNVFQTSFPGRWKIKGAQQFNIDHGSGTANSDGLGTGSGAFNKMQTAWTNLVKNVDENCNSVTLQNIDETFTEGNVRFEGTVTGGRCGAVNVDAYVQGNISTPTNVVWTNSSSSGDANVIASGANISVRGFKFLGGGSGQVAIQSQKKGTVFYGDVNFGLYTAGQHIFVQEFGSAYFDSGSYTISGNFANHLLCNTTQGEIIWAGGLTINLPSALTFSNFALSYSSGCSINFLGVETFTGTGAGAGSTGAKYFVGQGGTITLSGNTLPGATAGSFTAYNGLP